MLSSYVDENSKQLMIQRDKDRENFLKNFQNLLLQYDHIVLFPHVKPDGDCLGCSFGVKEIIKTNFPNKKAYVVGSNFGLYPWMDMKFDNLVNYDFDFSNAMALIMDVGESQRIQQFEKFFNSKVQFGAVVKVDHHAATSDFHIDLSWDDPTYAACCCQMVQIADFYGWKISPKAASFFYLGICTDSLRFGVDSVLPRTLILAAKTWRAGADYINIHRHLNRRTLHGIQVNSKLMDKATITGDIIWALVTQEDMHNWGIRSVKGLVGCFANIEENWMWILFSENEDGATVDVDIRSINVSSRDLAIKYGGGGHEGAAGCQKVPKEKVDAMVKDAADMVAEAKKQKKEDLLKAGQDDDDAAREKASLLKSTRQSIDDAKDLLREIKKEKESGESS